MCWRTTLRQISSCRIIAVAQLLWRAAGHSSTWFGKILLARSNSPPECAESGSMPSSVALHLVLKYLGLDVAVLVRDHVQILDKHHVWRRPLSHQLGFHRHGYIGGLTAVGNGILMHVLAGDIIYAAGSARQMTGRTDVVMDRVAVRIG